MRLGTPGVGTVLPGPRHARFTTPSETCTLTPGPVLRMRNRGLQRSFRTDDGYTARHHNYSEGPPNHYSGPGTLLRHLRKSTKIPVSTQMMVWHTTIERNKARTHATKWPNLEIITLSESSQTRETTCSRIPFMCKGQR